MKITINPTLDMETLQWISNDGVYEYSGPVMECKKGREVVEQNMKTGQATSKEQQAASQAAQQHEAGLLGQMEASTVPGALSPSASAQLASDRDQIANTYNGIRQTAFRTMGQRGLMSAPSGFAATAENAANLGEATADTGAYRNAQKETERQREFATGEEGKMAGQQGALANENLTGSTNAAVARSKMGSTAGDIIGGAAELAPIVAAPFTGGASLMALGKYARGGPVNAGVPIEVGEEGPELFVPPTPGRIIPNRRTFSNLGTR